MSVKCKLCRHIDLPMDAEPCLSCIHQSELVDNFEPKAKEGIDSAVVAVSFGQDILGRT